MLFLLSRGVLLPSMCGWMHLMNDLITVIINVVFVLLLLSKRRPLREEILHLWYGLFCFCFTLPQVNYIPGACSRSLLHWG